MSYDEMSAPELRDELHLWQTKALSLAREYRLARQARDWAWESGIGVALDQALAQVKRLERMLALGVAA